MPHGIGSRAADDAHPETVQVGGAGGAIQGSDQAVPAECLPGERSPASGDRIALPDASPDNHLTGVALPVGRCQDLARPED